MRSSKKKESIKLLSVSSETLRRLPRPHGGYEKFVPALVALARANPDAIAQAGLDLDELEEHLDTVASLATPVAEAEEQLKLLSDTRFYHDGLAYSLTLLLYDRAKSAARTDPSIGRALEPIEVFLKHKTKPKKAVAGAPVTP